MKYFHHNGILVLDSPLHTDSFPFENAYFLLRFRLLSTLKVPKTLTEMAVYGAFFSSLFSIAPVFTSLQQKRSISQKASVPKPYSKASVFISVLGRFSVNDRKRIKKYNSFPGSLILPPPGASED